MLGHGLLIALQIVWNLLWSLSNQTIKGETGKIRKTKGLDLPSPEKHRMLLICDNIIKGNKVYIE
jgi:hypothetical protein